MSAAAQSHSERRTRRMPRRPLVWRWERRTMLPLRLRSGRRWPKSSDARNRKGARRQVDTTGAPRAPVRIPRSRAICAYRASAAASGKRRGHRELVTAATTTHAPPGSRLLRLVFTSSTCMTRPPPRAPRNCRVARSPRPRTESAAQPHQRNIGVLEIGTDLPALIP